MSDIWCHESEPDIRYGYRIDEILVSKRTEYQFLQVVNSAAFGRMMLLDGKMMLTEKDEFIYHELISHVPMSFLGKASDVLVIGGGDGGTVRELVKYPDIASITLCEIDGDVVAAAKEFFPEVASGFSDKRVNVQIGDGIEFIKSHHDAFDLIIIDSTDPIGPGEGLFNRQFYSGVRKALTATGMVCAQTESPWFEGAILKKIHDNLGSSFPVLVPFVAAIPTYPRGLWSWTIGTARALDLAAVRLDKRLDRAGLRYLNDATLKSVLALPEFYQRKLIDCQN